MLLQSSLFYESPMLSIHTQLYKNYAYSCLLAKGLGVFCAFGAAEAALRVFYALKETSSNGLNRDRFYKIALPLVRAINFGLCAYNKQPFQVIVGFKIFVIYTLCTYKERDPDPYLVDHAIGKPFYWISQGTSCSIDKIKKVANFFFVDHKRATWLGIGTTFAVGNAAVACFKRGYFYC